MLHSISSTTPLPPSLERHLSSTTVRTARFDSKKGCYTADLFGRAVLCGGLLNVLEKRHYPRYKTSRRRRATQAKGSSKVIGKRVDKEIAEEISDSKRDSKLLHPFTSAILKHIRKDKKETLLAAQVPVRIPNEFKMTQCDLLTFRNGKMILYEIKTGMPVSLNRAKKQQPTLENISSVVPCTKANIWQLQLHYTRRALEQAGVAIDEAKVLHVYQHQKKGVVIKEYEQPDWIKKL